MRSHTCHFVRIYTWFWGLPTSTPETATFSDGALMMFAKCSRNGKTIMSLIVWKNIKRCFPGIWGLQEKSIYIFLILKSIFLNLSGKKQMKVPFLTLKTYSLSPKNTSFYKTYYFDANCKFNEYFLSIMVENVAFHPRKGIKVFFNSPFSWKSAFCIFQTIRDIILCHFSFRIQKNSKPQVIESSFLRLC